MSDLSVKRHGLGYCIMRGDEKISGTFASGDCAEMAVDRKRRKEALIDLPCITCGTHFGSEGAHNRMCDDCRANEGEHAGAYTLVRSRPLAVTS